MIQAQCGGCGKKYAVPDQYGGKKVRCKQCSAVVDIPPAPGPAEEAPPPLPEPEEADASGSPKPPAGAPRGKVPNFGKRPGGAKKGPVPSGAPGPARKSLGGKKLGARPRVAKKEPLPDGEGAAPAPPSRKRLLALGGIAVGVLAVAGGIYYYFFMGSEPERPARKAVRPPTEAVESKRAPESEAVASEGRKAATKESQEGGGAPVTDALAVFPSDSNLVAHLAFGRLANLPGLKEAIDAKVTEEKWAQLFTDADFDPRTHLRDVWVAGSLKEASMEGGEPPVTFVLEGAFDKSTFLEALKKHSMVGATPKTVGAFEVYEIQEEGVPGGFLTFVAEDKLLFGLGDAFNKALQTAGGGTSVRSNQALAGLSGDFASDKTAWVAFELTKDMKDAMASQSKPNQPPLPKLDALLLSMDPTPDGMGVSIEVRALCPSAEDAKQAQGWVGGQVSLARMMLPPPLRPLLQVLKIAPAEGEEVHLSLVLNEEAMKTIQESLGPMLGMAPGPTAEGEEEGTEGEGGEEESATGEGSSAEEEEGTEEPAAGEMTGESKAEPPGKAEPAESEEPAAEEEKAPADEPSAKEKSGAGAEEESAEEPAAEEPAET